jgi:predicted aspartyl protease
MIRIQLLLTVNGAEIVCNFRRKDGSFERITAFIDTGAETSFLPNELMDILDYRLSDNSRVEIVQAGISKQAFIATEAYITVFFEDMLGHQTHEIEARVWFADAYEYLIGFSEILDSGILHIDMTTRSGWFEI